jgi:hypothetical protein
MVVNVKKKPLGYGFGGTGHIKGLIWVAKVYQESRETDEEIGS